MKINTKNYIGTHKILSEVTLRNFILTWNALPAIQYNSTSPEPELQLKPKIGPCPKLSPYPNFSPHTQVLLYDNIIMSHAHAHISHQFVSFYVLVEPWTWTLNIYEDNPMHQQQYYFRTGEHHTITMRIADKPKRVDHRTRVINTKAQE